MIAGSIAKAQTPLAGMTLYGDFLNPGAFGVWSFMTGGIPGLFGTGRATLRIPLPNDPALVGLSTYWQGFVLDSKSPLPIGISHTSGLAVTIVR